MREEAEWVNAIKTAVEKYGRLDILVNSAGTVAPGRVEETTVETWDDQMDVYVKAVFLGTKYLAKSALTLLQPLSDVLAGTSREGIGEPSPQPHLLE